MVIGVQDEDEVGDNNIAEEDGERAEEKVDEKEEEANLPGQVEEGGEDDEKDEAGDGADGEQPTPDDDPAADEADDLDM